MTAQDLLSRSDILKLFRCPAGSFCLRMALGTLPKPSIHISRAPIWFRADVDAWIAAHNSSSEAA